MKVIASTFDRTQYHPLFTNKAIEPTQALEWAIRLTQEFDDVLPENYVEIPHAISCFFISEQGLAILSERTFAENDPYIAEESQLAPPEMQTDRFWRRSIHRLTYLVCQVLLSLLIGKSPKYPLSTVTFNHLIGRYSTDQITHLQSIFCTGLHLTPSERFPNFRSLGQALHQIQQKFQTRRLTVVSSVPKFSSNSSCLINGQYEILVWLPKYENIFKLPIIIPSTIILGRKIFHHSSEGTTTSMLIRQSEKKFEVHHEQRKENGQILHYLGIEGDSCVSRNHLALYFPENERTPYLADIGSTHGVIVFSDASCEHSTSILVKTGEKIPFRCTDDQYLQIGNTYVRIRTF